MEESNHNQTNTNIPNSSSNTTFSCITNLSLLPDLSEPIADTTISHPPTSPLTSKSSSSTASFSCTSPLNNDNNDDKLPTLSLFPQVSEKLVATKQPTLSLFPEHSQNLATTPPSSSSSPSISLSLSLQICTPDNVHASSSSAPKRLLVNEISNKGHVPVKRSRAKEELLKNKAVRPRLISLPRGAGVEEKEGHWIIKKLTTSDVSAILSRLLLPKHEVMAHVLDFMDPETKEKCQSVPGIKVSVRDMDTESQHTLELKQWASTGCFQLVKNWISEFVKRRNLQKDDVIALRWEQKNSRFCFRVQSRASSG